MFINQVKTMWRSLWDDTPYYGTTFGDIPRIIRQSTIALLICALADIFAGLTLAMKADILEVTPGLIILVPGVMAMRGNIFGSFGAMLGTSFHIGEISPPYLQSYALRQQISGVVLRTIVMSLLLAIVVKIIAEVLGLAVINTYRLMLISLLTGIMSGFVLIAITLVIVVVSFNRGWDPDNLSVPLITAAGDITTMPFLFLSVALSYHISDPSAIAICLVSMAASLIALIFALKRKRTVLARILRQSLPILVICAFLSSFAGTFMGLHMDTLIGYTALLLLIPVINAEAGNLGGILSSQLTSAYHLGATAMGRNPDHHTRRSFFSILILSLILFPALGYISGVVSSRFCLSTPGLFDLVTISVAAGVLATILAIFITYYLTYVFLRIGVDPDNVVIPIITSIIDLLGTSSVLLAAATFISVMS